MALAKDTLRGMISQYDFSQNISSFCKAAFTHKHENNAKKKQQQRILREQKG